MPPKEKKPKIDPCGFEGFAETKIHDFVSQNFQGTVSQETSSFLSTAVGYIGKEIMELSVNAAITRLGKGKNFKGKERKDVKLTVEDVNTAINSDRDLKKLLDDCQNQDD